MQRLEKLLEDAQIKLSSVVTDLCGVASRRILTALMSGVTDPAALVLLRGGLKVSAADLTEALTGRLGRLAHQFRINEKVRGSSPLSSTHVEVRSD